jgi:hypothetical protein
MWRPVIVLVVALAVAAVAQPVYGEEWGWPGRFTDNSSPEMQSVFSGLLARSIGDDAGTPVQDVHFLSDYFDFHLIAGTVYLEPEIEGYPVGAFFAGEATVTFNPASPRATSDLFKYFGTSKIEKMPVSFAYFYTLRGKSLLEQLEVADEPTAPFEARGPYDECKKAFRQTGSPILHSFLNRDGRGLGTVHVVFAPEAIRTSSAPHAHLMYSFDPNEELEVKLSVFGHPEAFMSPGAKRFLEKYPTYKYFFWEVTAINSARPGFKPHGTTAHYYTKLAIGKGMKEVDEETTIVFTPTAGVAALELDLTPRLRVQSITGPAGQSLPFIQWKHIEASPTFDDRVVVQLPEPLEPEIPVELKIVSKGPLFDSFAGAHRLVDEDTWYPQLDDPEGAMFDLDCSVPKNMRAVGAGKVLTDEVVDGKRRYHFSTTQPALWSTFYFGPYDIYEAKAGDTKVELFQSSIRDDISPEIVGTAESPKYTVNEIANAVNVYNQIFGHPLEIDHLRVATTPTGHGRGFEGLILLSKYGGTSSDSSASDFFRAHEVAHMWWGNMVRTKNWPEDRWLSESLAEYSAMEYFLARFQKPEKTQTRIQEEWIKPILKDYVVPLQTLTGEKMEIRTGELSPLIAGDQNVYTKGPLMVHHLRYVFKVMKKNDDVFWEMITDFIGEHKYERASTDDFIQVAEKHMGGRLDWFWNQWLYGTEIPIVSWSHTVERAEDGSYLLTVKAEQANTEYVMPIPVYVHMKGGKTLDTPLIMQGKTGELKVKLRTKPSKVTLNDNHEALIRLKPS